MWPRPLQDIQKADLEALIADQMAEGKSIEYKREFPGSGDGGPVKILRAITSFANTNGGHVLYGVEAADGLPAALPGIEFSSEDEVKQRIENLCRNGVQPRLQVRSRLIGVAEKRSVLIIEVQKSWAAPHRVTVGGHDKFYGRNSSESYPLDVDELRTAFTLSQTVAERARRFRQERLADIAAGDTPVPCPKVGKLALHVMSMSAFTDAGLRALPDATGRKAFMPIGWAAGHERLNLDGYVSSSSYPPHESTAYVQLFRTGIVEGVLAFDRHFRADNLPGEQYLDAKFYEPHVVGFTKHYVNGLETIGAGAPYFVFLSFVGVAGYKLSSGSWARYEEARCERDNIFLPEVVLQNSSDAIAPKLRPLLDMVWNAFGYERSPFFDDAGELKKIKQ